MRILFITMIAVATVFSATAQNEKYVAAMKKNIAEMDSAYVKKNFSDVGNNFERIATAEKTQWLPYYYAAYCNVMTAFMQQDKTKTDGITDKAEALIKKAEELAGGENSETCVIKSMIASAHMMVDPQSRWMQYGQTSSTNIERAKKLDPTNPRPFYLDGQGKFFTPEAFGGGKAIAKPVLEKAMEMFSAFKPSAELMPVWGQLSTQYFLNQCK